MAGFLLYQNAVADEVKGSMKLASLFNLQRQLKGSVFYKLMRPQTNYEPRFAPIPEDDEEPFTLLFPATTKDSESTHIGLALRAPLTRQRHTIPKDMENKTGLLNNLTPENDVYNFALLTGFIKGIKRFEKDVLGKEEDQLTESDEKAIRRLANAAGLFKLKRASPSGILIKFMLDDKSASDLFLDRFRKITRMYYDGEHSMTRQFDLIRALPETMKSIFTNCYLVFFLAKETTGADGKIKTITAPCIEYLGDFNYDAHKRGSAPVRVFTCAIGDGGLEFGMHKPEDVRDLFRPEAASEAARFNVNLARELLSSTGTFEDKVRSASQNLSA